MPMAHPGFSVLSDAFEADPYRHFARLREQAPVHHEPAIDSYFLSRHQDVRRVLTDHRAFTTETLQARAEPVMRGPVLAQMTGAEHTAKRKIVVQGLTGEALREQMNTVRARAAELLAPLLARGRMDLVADFGKPFAVQVTMDVLGLDVEDWRQVAAWHSGVAEFITGLTLTPSAAGTAWSAPSSWRPTSSRSSKSGAANRARTSYRGCAPLSSTPPR